MARILGVAAAACLVAAIATATLVETAPVAHNERTSIEPANDALVDLGPVRHLRGTYGCTGNNFDDGTGGADPTKVGASNDPDCYSGNYTTPEAQGDCESQGYSYLGNSTSGALSNADITVTHDGTYLNITPSPGVTVIWAFVKAADGYNIYFGDLVGLHGPRQGGNPAPNGISHWGVCYQVTT